MLSKELKRHSREVARHMRNGHFEQTPEGILLPKMGAHAAGEYHHWSNGEDHQVDHNLITDEGLTYMLEIAIGGADTMSALPNWYLTLWNANYTPVGGIAAVDFPATAGEITSATEGFSEGNRLAFVSNQATAGVMENLNNRCDFTITTASSVTIRGAALLSENPRGATTGKLFSIARFAQDRVQYDSDIFSLAYQVTLSAV